MGRIKAVGTGIFVAFAFGLAVASSADAKSDPTCEWNTVGYCEKTITPGVSISIPSISVNCTAGPLGIIGNETYMLTAGHCFSTTEKLGKITAEVTAAYPTEGGQKPGKKKPLWEEKKQGTSGTTNGGVWVAYDTEYEVAAVKVAPNGEGEWLEAANPFVPAAFVEWGPKSNLNTPPKINEVVGPAVNAVGEESCHQGQTSAEECGVVLTDKASCCRGTSVITKDLVASSAYIRGGDSGGPYFSRKNPGPGVLIQGTAVGYCEASTPTTCPESYYEPLITNSSGSPEGTATCKNGSKLITGLPEASKDTIEKMMKKWKGGTKTEQTDVPVAVNCLPVKAKATVEKVKLEGDPKTTTVEMSVAADSDGSGEKAYFGFPVVSYYEPLSRIEKAVKQLDLKKFALLTTANETRPAG